MIPLGLAGLAPAPATAAACAPAAYTAHASANLVELSALDLRPLGLRIGPVADLRLATTAAGLDARQAIAAQAAARYADAHVAGIKLSTAALDSAVSQQAPPSHAGPARYNALAQHLGVADLGTGDLSAQATWSDAMACGTQTGPAGVASASVADLNLLSLVRAPHNLSSTAVTGTRVVDGRAASV
ncbi:MAG: hypothetical protein HOV83_29155, partial [Catenulispora sp.]|nr:hypothetical protein [Catenulispora sp.]